MSSVKSINKKFNLINDRVKYGTDGGINVDSGTLFVNPSNNRIGINTLSPSTTLDISGSLKSTTITDFSNSVGNNNQVLSKVNEQNMWFYPQLSFQGNDMFSLNQIDTTTISNLTGTSYRQGGGCLSLNGNIYFGPFGKYSDNNTKTLKINPYTNSRSYINNKGNYGYSGMVCADNGKIFILPYSSVTDILIIDTFNNDAVSYLTVSGLTTSSYFGLVNYNNFIYAIPRNANNVLKINPVDLTVTTDISGIDVSGYDISSNTDKFFGGIVGTDGNIYCIPRSARRVLRFNPITNVVQQSNTVDLSGYQGGALASNGNIYMVPKITSNIGVIDISNFTVSKITTYIALNGTVTNISSIGPTASQKFNSAISAPNGLIYCIPEGGNVWLTINPETNIATQIASLGGSDGFAGSALSPNGKIYVAPLNANYVPIVKTGLPTQNNWMLSPTFNKTP